MPKVTAKQMTERLVQQREETSQNSITNLEVKYETVWLEIDKKAQEGKAVAKIVIERENYAELKYLLELNGYAVTNTSNEESSRYSIRISWPQGTNNVTGDLPLTALAPTDLNFYLNDPCSSRLYPTGGVAPYNFTVTKGVWPAGITLTDNDDYCTIAGTPTVTGNGITTVLVEDALSQIGSYQIKWICSK